MNVGKWDRIIRGLLGIGVSLLLPRAWALLGLIPIATSLMGWCPLYRVFGISTCPRPTTI